MLELADIEPYLRERGLISARALVDGGLRIVDVSRLNRVFLVTAEGEPGLVVKLADESSSVGMAREAAVLERLWACGGNELTRFLPAVAAYDGEEGALILRAPPGARDLTHHHSRGRFSCGLARQAGRALAALHELDPGVADGFPGRVETVAGTCLHKLDLEEVHAMSTASLELTGLIQRSEELCAGLDELVGSWSPESTIHGDVRWDNLLTISAARSNRWTRLQLIDWEHAASGEPGLDVGAFLGEYLRAWVGSIPIVDPSDPGRLLSQARMPLSSMRPAIHAFWDAYASHRPRATADLNFIRERSVRFAAVRLLSAAMEEAQTLGELEPGVLNLVPVSRNILMHPCEASAHLLGLDAYRHVA